MELVKRNSSYTQLRCERRECEETVSMVAICVAIRLQQNVCYDDNEMRSFIFLRTHDRNASHSSRTETVEKFIGSHACTNAPCCGCDFFHVELDQVKLAADVIFCFGLLKNRNRNNENDNSSQHNNRICHHARMFCSSSSWRMRLAWGHRAYYAY